MIDGDVIREVQVKAVQSHAAIVEHFSRYPDIDVVATSEVYASVAHVFPGRVTN